MIFSSESCPSVRWNRLSNTYALVVLFLIPALHAIAQNPEPGSLSIPFTARDAAFHPSDDALYVASFDENAVAIVDPRTGDVVDSIAVGKGPAQLAFSADGSVLAVVNRTDGTATFIDAQTRNVLHGVDTGRFPSAIAALPGGGFAVANAMDDSVTLIDQRTGTVTSTLGGLASVPIAVTATDRFLAVGVASPPRVLVLEPGQSDVVRTIDLDAQPESMATLTDTTILTATDAGVYRINLESGATDLLSDSGSQSVRTTGARVYTLDATGVQIRNTHFDPIDSVAEVRGNVLAVRGTAWAVIDTASGSLFVPEMPAAMAQATPEPEVTPLPDARPVVSSDSLPPPTSVESDSEAVDSEPVVEPTEVPTPVPDETETEPAITDTTGSDETPAAVETRTAAAESEAERTAPPRYEPTDLSFRGFNPSAPFLGAGQSKIFRQKLDAALQFEGPLAGLFGLNWENAEPDRFDKWTRVGSVDTFEGDAEFLVDGARIETDRFVRNEETRELHFEAPMQVTRDNDSFSAGSMQLFLPPPAERLEMPQLPILPRGYRPPRSDVEVGWLTADDTHWIEPPLRELTADHMEGDVAAPEFDMTEARGHAGELYFHARELELHGYDSMIARRAWVSTCNRAKPHYKVHFRRGKLNDREVFTARHAWLQFRYFPIPLYVPYARSPSERYWLDFRAGNDDRLGTFMDLGQWFPVSPYFDLGIRTFPTSKAGFGIGVDGDYDYREKPASLLFRGEGDFQTFFVLGDGSTESTEDDPTGEPDDRGFAEYHHRQELTHNTALLSQLEFWSDSAVLKDYFVQDFRNLNGPRSFTNVTTAKKGYVLSTSAVVDPHDFLHNTERLPETSIHLIDREIAKNLYLSVDSIQGYYRFEPESIGRGRFDFFPEPLDTMRSFNLARLSYDFDAIPGINITPYIEGDLTAYSERPSIVASGEQFDEKKGIFDPVGPDPEDDVRIGVTGGVTVQSRVQKTYRGFGPFRTFKHIVVPSVSYMHRPDPSEDINTFADPEFGLFLEQQRRRRVEEFDRTPTLDLLDVRPGRERIEAKLENVILAKRKDSNTTYELLNFNLYYGNDFDAQFIESESIEAEFRFRPWETWGLSASAEHTEISRGPETPSGDFDRLIAFLFYRDRQTPNRLNGRVGITVTDFTFRGRSERRLFYGSGLRLTDNWSIGFEHDFDLIEDRISRQRYEIRRLLHKWETSLQYVKKDSGFEINLQIALIDFPGGRLRSF